MILLDYKTRERVTLMQFASLIASISIIIYALVFGLGIYISVLIIKALRIYIQKNS